MARDDDVSSEHFDWLVEARSRNQRSTAALYRIMEANVVSFEKNLVFQKTVQDLTAVAFSLWRAVFLSDLTGEQGHQLADVRRFLRSLIAHNTVLYQTDFTSREWSFHYYLQHALFRLHQMGVSANVVQSGSEAFGQGPGSANGDWSQAQQALETAISSFAKVIGTHDKP